MNNAWIVVLGALVALFGAFTEARGAGTVIGWGQNAYSQATNPSIAGVVFEAVAAGSDNTSPNSIGFTLGLKPDGTIIGWGNNTYFQSTSLPASATNIVALAAGEYHGVALRSDGKVFAWGRNNTTQTNVPAALSSNVIAIAAGSSMGDHSLALKSDGTVVGWGLNSAGQINVPSQVTNVVQIAAGALDSLALRADGTVVVWGSNVSTQTNVPASATNVVAIAAGTSHCLALRTNGTVVAWGSNISAQTNVPASASNVVAIAAGDQHSIALRRDGTLVVWGNNSYLFSLPAGISNVTAIASGARHALALVGDGTPAITVPPRNQSVYPGGKAVFVAMAAGPGNLTYQWQANGINIPGATGPILVLTNVQPINSGWYQVTVRNSYGTDTASAGLTLLDGRLSITQQPVANTNVDAGSNAMVSITATGGLPMYFQWWKDGSAIPNATNSSFAITNAQADDQGGYSVIVSNVYGTVASSTGLVSVIYHSPTILAQPIGTNVPVGGSFTLRVSAAGTLPLNVQWRTNGTPIPGATDTNYVINSAQLADAGLYDVVITNSAGVTNSIAVTVNVGYAPVITTHPLPLTLNAGDVANFSGVVTGTAPISLQWTLNGYAMANQTNSSLTLTNVQATNIGTYRLVATNIFGIASSSNAPLNLNGFVFAQWAGLVAYYALDGNPLDSSGYGNDGTNVGAIAPGSDRFGNTNGAMAFDGNNSCIRCKSGAYFGTNFTISAWVNETVYANWARILDFGNGAALDNTLFAITDGTTGRPDLEAYEGVNRKGPNDNASAVPLNTWGNLVATWNGTQLVYYYNGTRRTVVNVSLNRVTVFTTLNYIGRSNWKASGDSDFAGTMDDIRIFNRTLPAADIAQLFATDADVPVITQQPQARTTNSGSTVSFAVAATANHPLTYQWSKSGVAISGATNAVLLLTNVGPGDIGFYSVTASNAFIGVLSSGALLSLTDYNDLTWNGLVAYYPFNANAKDLGGNGLNGVTNASVTWTTNRFGNVKSALGLNGSTSFVSVNDPGALLNFDIRSNNYTVCAWVMLNSLSTYQTFLIDRGTTQNQHSSYSLNYDNGAARFWAQMWDGGNFVNISGASAVSTGQWYQLSLVVSNRVVRFYVNGVLQGSSTLIAAFGSTKNTENIRDFGRWAGVSFVNYVNGSMDDIRFYNRALSSDEVAYLYGLESQSTLLPPPRLTASPGAGPALNLSFDGFPGTNYLLQSATNLQPPVQWLTILTNSADSNGVWQVTDTNRSSSRRFYRVTAQ